MAIVDRGDTAGPSLADAGLMRRAYGASRGSAARRAVARAVAARDAAFTIEDLATAVRDSDGAVGTATVYRAVAAMVETGWVEKVGRSGGHALYLRCDADGHHHHFLCTGCGAASHAPCPLDARVVEEAERRGFVVTAHEVSVYGLCAECLSKPASERG